MLPSFRDWIFSIKTFVAAMVALYVALKMELPRPYWALATVYIVSNPFVGATASRSLYRVLGTLLGASAAVVIVPPLVDTPYLMSFAIAVWMGVMLYLSIQDRTARSYLFVLAGYTTPLISYPVVFDPSGIFDVAAARTEEILVGIVVASIVNAVLLPNSLTPVLSERTVSWFNEAANFARRTLAGQRADRWIVDGLRRMASTVNGLDVLLSQLAYDATRPDVVAGASQLRGRMELLVPIIAALADPLRIYLNASVPGRGELVDMLEGISTWIASTLARPDSHPEGEVLLKAQELRTALIRLEPATDQLTQWYAMLLSSILWRLTVLIDLWEDCISLQHRISIDNVAGWRPRFRHWRIGSSHRYTDHGIMLFATVTAVGAIFAACALWINSDWVDGGTGMALAAVACCFFAGLDDPAPDIFRFLVGATIALAIAGFYLFAIFPAVNDFAMLVLALAVPFLVFGTMLPRPPVSLIALVVAFNTAAFLNLQGSFNVNAEAFLNGGVSALTGLLFAYVWTRVTRPFGAELAVRRMTRSAWLDLAFAAGPHAADDQRELFARMLDRLMLLIPRLGSPDDREGSAVAALRDIRAGLNTLDLQIERANLPSAIQSSIDAILARLQRHYDACAKTGVRQPLALELIESIDSAISRTAQAVVRGLSPAALHALVLLRISLHPEGAAPREHPQGA